MSARATIRRSVLSEDFAEALRQGHAKNAGAISPYMACLFPLLETLGWHDYQRDVIEALPHYYAYLGLTELRNILMNLGFESQAMNVRLCDVAPELLPALYVNGRGEVILLKEIDAETGEFKYFEGRSNDHKQGKLSGRGTLYVFTDFTATHAVARPQSTSFFSRLMSRFQHLLVHLLGMTLLLNLIAVAVPLFIMTVYDWVIGSKTVSSLPYLVVGIAFALCIELALRLLRANTLGRVAGRIDYLVGTQSFKQVLALPPIMTERSSVTAQLSKLRQFDSIRDFFAGAASTALLETPFALLFVTMIAILGGWLALVPCSVAVFYLLFGLLWLPRMRAHLQHSAHARAEREQLLMETFSGLQELKALGAEDIWLERYKESTADTVIANRKASIDQAVLNSVTNTVMMLSATAMLGLGTLKVMAGSMSVGALIAVMTFSWKVLVPLQGLFMTCFRLETVSAGVRDLDQLMGIKVERHGRKSSLMSSEIEGRIRFDRVSFRYGPDFDPALVGVSFKVPAKAFLAVVGHNGSGKSTLLKLVNALYQLQSGTIYIDDVDTRQFNASDLRRIVAYVPQNPSLFHGSIAQNLRLKDPLATENDLRLACFKTGILRAIEALPRGFDTIVGDENTRRLPSGLIRGICIARAFVRRAPILLLDEPASGLDSDGDESLMLQLRSLKGRVTVVMVSHRPSHISLADRVLVIEQGMATRLCTPDAYFDRTPAPESAPKAASTPAPVPHRPIQEASNG